MVKMCNKCKNNNTKWGGLCKCGYYPFIKDDIYTCPDVTCNGTLTDINISDNDLLTIADISEDPSFLEAMIKLKEDDIIEYNLKMSQFKAQLNTQQSNQHTQDNQIHCPYCHSTNVKKITNTAKVVNIAMFGLLGNKRKHEWHCNNCKSDF